jgi:hypothetical protein
MNEAFGKKLVKDTRDNTYWFGEIRSPDPAEEAGFGFDHTDIIQVGLGTLEVQIPASGARIFGNIKSLADAIVIADSMGFRFYDCDHEYVVGDDYPVLFPDYTPAP